MDARPERASGEANGSGPRPIAWAVCIAISPTPEIADYSAINAGAVSVLL